MQEHRYLTVNHNYAGPGVSANLEALVPDILLQSQTCEGKVLGRPLVIGMMDNWAPFFYSLTFSFRPPARGLLNAVEAALSNKADYCAQFGSKISTNEWPIDGLPSSVAADGETIRLLGVSRLEELFIKVAANSPVRNRLKTILERTSPRLCNELLDWRTGRYGRLASSSTRATCNNRIVLTPAEFQRVLNECVLRHHQSLLKDYQLTAEMIAAGVQPRPMDLLRFGIMHRTVCFRKIDLAKVRHALRNRKSKKRRK